MSVCLHVIVRACACMCAFVFVVYLLFVYVCWFECVFVGVFVVCVSVCK